MQNEIADALRLGLTRISGDCFGIERSRIDVETATGMSYVGDEQSDDERQC